MAVQNDPRIYSGGGVVLDSTPTTQLYANLMARKQAKDDAVNQYFNDLGNKINTAGVRTQDMDNGKDGINREIEKWRENWVSNKDAIKKGGMSQQEHMSKFQQILRRIDQSKQRAKTELEIGKAKFEGKYDPDEDDLHVLDNISKSIYDPTSYKQDGVSEYGWQDLSPNTPPFDEKKFTDAITGTIKPIKQYGKPGQYNPQTGQRAVPFELKYDPDQIKKIAEAGGRFAETNKSARKRFNKILDDPQSEEYQELNKLYQSVFKPEVVKEQGMTYEVPNIMDTPEKVGKALAIARSSGSFGGGEELRMDVQESDRRRRALAEYNSRLILSRSKSASGESLADYDIIGAYSPKIKKKTVITDFKPEEFDIILDKDIDPSDKKLFGEVRPYKDYDTGETFYKVLDNMDLEGKGGQVIYRAKVAQANLDKTALNEVKRGRLDMKPNEGVKKEKFPLPKGKPRKVEQEGKIFVWDSETGKYKVQK